MKALQKIFIPVILAATALASCYKAPNDEDQIFIVENGGEDDINFKEEENDPSPDPTGTFDYASLGEMRHPRLLIDSLGFVSLKNKVLKAPEANPTLVRAHNMIMAIADESLNSSNPISYKFDASGRRILTQSRKALQRIFSCSYAYKMTGRGEYLTRVKADMQTVCSFQDWNGIASFLDAAEMATAVAIGYDWCYYNLPLSLRRQAHRSLVDYCLAVTGESHDYPHMDYNWNQVCYGGVVMSSLALYEKERNLCARRIEEALVNNGRTIGVSYSPDGNYPEGYSYWSYGTHFQVLILAALEKIFGNTGGLDEEADLRKTAEWMLFMSGPSGEVFNYSDCTRRYSDPQYCMWWFAWKFKDVSMLYNEQRLLNNYTESDVTRLIPMCALFSDGLDFSKPIDHPSKHLWSGRGDTPVVLVHGDWSFSETDTFLGVKGGMAKRNHGHMDAGSFVFDAYGKRWSEDLMVPEYTSIESAISAAGGNFWDHGQSSMRWDVFVMTNYAHSTLTVNGEKHNVGGFATLESVIDTETEKGGVFNIAPALGNSISSAIRTVKLVNYKQLVVIDEITASGSPANVWWRMMTRASVDKQSSFIELSFPDITQKMRLEVASSSASIKPQLTTWAPHFADGARTWDNAQDGKTIVGHTFTVPAGASVTITTTLSPVEQ